MDYDRRTALMVSASEGKDSIVKLLLKAKADFEVLDVFGTNALVGALRGGHTGSTKLLLNAGCSLVACPKVTLTDCIESIHDGSPGELLEIERVIKLCQSVSSNLSIS